MGLNVTREVAAMQRMTVPQLRNRYAEVFGETTNANNRAWLLKRIAWRLQAVEEGDLSERARQRAAELANDADLRTIPPKDAMVEVQAPAPEPVTLPFPNDNRLPQPGTIITRPYKDRTLQVLVRTDGFECEGVVYPSLSAAAKAITGTHCNGFHFFRLNKQGASA